MTHYKLKSDPPCRAIDALTSRTRKDLYKMVRELALSELQDQVLDVPKPVCRSKTQENLSILFEGDLLEIFVSVKQTTSMLSSPP